jgi:hypothetical protein
MHIISATMILAVWILSILYRPVCRDGTLGINLRLLLRESREMGLMAE